MNYLKDRNCTSEIPIPIDGYKALSMCGKNGRVGFSSWRAAEIEINKKYSHLNCILFQDFYYFDGSVHGKIERRTAIIISEKDYNLEGGRHD